MSEAELRSVLLASSDTTAVRVVALAVAALRFLLAIFISCAVALTRLKRQAARLAQEIAIPGPRPSRDRV